MASAYPDEIPSTAPQDPQATCDVHARRVIRDLLDGGRPNGPADECGPWAEVVAELYDTYSEGGTVAVRTVWTSLTRHNADLIKLVSADDDGPLAGAGKAVVEILMEGTEGDPPQLPRIDHARKLEDLANFVNRVMALPRRFKVRNRKRAISYAIRQLLLGQGRLLQDAGEGEPGGTPHAVDDDGAVWPLSDDLLTVKAMLSRTGLNASELAFKWLIEDLAATACDKAPRVSLAHFWTQRDGARSESRPLKSNGTLYVSSGPTAMVKAWLNDGSAELETVPNGTDGVYFGSDAVLPRWQPAEPLAPHKLAAFCPAVVAPPEVPEYTPEVQKLLFEAWLAALVADLRPLPILVALGDKGGGKTHLIRGVTLLTTCDQPTTISQDPRDAWASAVWRPVLALDNVDSAPAEWLPELLAAATTGIDHERRKMYTSTIERHRVRTAFALSTRTACFARPDVAERILPIVTGVFEDADRKSDSALIAELREKRDRVLTWITRKAVYLLHKLPDAPTLPGRFVDYSRIVWAFDPDNAETALRALRKAQALTVGDADPLIAAIVEYTDALLGECGRWEGRASALVDALQDLEAGLPWLGKGKAIARRLREGKETLSLFGLSLESKTSGNNTVFILRK